MTENSRTEETGGPQSMGSQRGGCGFAANTCTLNTFNRETELAF